MRVTGRCKDIRRMKTKLCDVNPSALDMGLGGAIAGFVTGLIAGPPKWFSS